MKNIVRVNLSLFSYPLVLMYVLDAQKDGSLSTDNICFG